MRNAKVFVKGVEAGVLTEIIQGKEYLFEYVDGFNGPGGITKPQCHRIKDRVGNLTGSSFFEGLFRKGSTGRLLKINKM